MKTYAIRSLLLAIVATMWLMIGDLGDNLAYRQKALLIFGGLMVMQRLFIPRWLRSEALREALRPIRHLKEGEKIEIEGHG